MPILQGGLPSPRRVNKQRGARWRLQIGAAGTSFWTDDARRMLEELRSHTGDKASQARLDFAAADLADMPDPPFSDPYHGAAYFSLDGETVAFASRPPRPCPTHGG